jgi:chromate reductase
MSTETSPIRGTCTTDPIRVLGISGSLRQGSHNRVLLRAAAGELPPRAEFVEYSGLADLPAYDEDLDATIAPAAVQSLRQAIEAADALIISTPEYNGSVPGALKNALDWASRPWPRSSLRGKPVSVIGASTGLFGAVWAQAELRKILDTIGANVIVGELPVGQAHEAFDPEGRLSDPELSARLSEVVASLTAAVSPPALESAAC